MKVPTTNSNAMFRHRGMIVVGASLALPIFSVGLALLLGADGPELVVAALAGGVLGVIYAWWSWSALVGEAVSATLERDSAVLALADAECDKTFRERVDRSLRASQNEPETIEIALRSVAEVMPDAELSLLLNLPDESRIGWVVELRGGTLKPAVPMGETPTCLALVNLSSITTPDTRAVGACQHLRSHQGEASSMCIPVRLGERTLGSVNILRAPGESVSISVRESAEWAVERAAVRIAEQRLQRGPSISGRPDPVTGLPGLPALRNQLRDLVRTHVPFCAAVVSIDHFEELRYQEGQDVAEIALGFTADALCSTVRPGDFVCRISGPRFAVVLAECHARQATAVLERVRESLALLLAVESQTTFTCSAGIVESQQATSLDELLSMSEQACEQAASAGGNRVSLAFEADHM